MIRTVLLSAALLAAAGAANAGEVRVSLAGKTEASVRAELIVAAQAACHDVAVIDYSPCVLETYQRAMSRVARIKAIKTAMLTF